MVKSLDVVKKISIHFPVLSLLSNVTFNLPKSQFALLQNSGNGGHEWALWLFSEMMPVKCLWHLGASDTMMFGYRYGNGKERWDSFINFSWNMDWTPLVPGSELGARETDERTKDLPLWAYHPIFVVAVSCQATIFNAFFYLKVLWIFVHHLPQS